MPLETQIEEQDFLWTVHCYDGTIDRVMANSFQVLPPVGNYVAFISKDSKIVKVFVSPRSFSPDHTPIPDGRQ